MRLAPWSALRHTTAADRLSMKEKSEQKKFQHKKSLGQHFLNSDVVPRWLCDAGEVRKGDIVLEIGPGTGALTTELLARGARVAAVEADPRAIESLKETFAGEIESEQLQVEHGDMRKLTAKDVAQIFDLRDQEFKIVANIPYYLSGLLFRTFLDSPVQPKSLVFLVQKEIAERIARDPKESLLSLSVKVFGDPTYICTVKRGHFTPPPKVDSAIIAVRNIHQSFASPTERDHFFTLLKTGFGQKRKQLLGNLSTLYPRISIQAVFNNLPLSHTTRAEDLTLRDWQALATACSHLNQGSG